MKATELIAKHLRENAVRATSKSGGAVGDCVVIKKYGISVSMIYKEDHQIMMLPCDRTINICSPESLSLILDCASRVDVLGCCECQEGKCTT